MTDTNKDDTKSWVSDLEGYIRQGEPKRAAKAKAWQAAIGLQDVDNLKVSDYLLDTAKQNIEGEIDTQEARQRIDSYYEARRARGIVEDRTEEADKVAQRISELLEEESFRFSPVTLSSIHKWLFNGILEGAGVIRDYNITKKEWILNDATVLYAPYDVIRDSLEHDFNREADHPYDDDSVQESIRHISRFVSDIWQVHPFGEGNTRTTAVFIIKYLRAMGFTVENETFRDNSWYFRNALVRANYDDYPKGIRATTEFLERFFENLLLGAHNDLKNCYIHVDYGALEKDGTVLSASSAFPKCKSCTLNCTLGELAVLRLIADNPRITQKGLAAVIGISERTVRTRTVELQAKGLLQREGGRRNGEWVIPSAIRGEIDAAR